MQLRGVLIPESLDNDHGIWDLVEVTGRSKRRLVREVAERLRSPGWYFHVERDRVMEMKADDAGSIQAAREYGKSIGIHPEQLCFERFMGNPFDQ